MKARASLIPRALTVLSLALAGSSHAALIGYWNFNEGVGSTAADFSSNNYDGTVVAGGGGSPSWVAGHTTTTGDYSLDFKGWNDHVTIPTGSISGMGAFTIAFWAEADYLGNYVYPLTLSTDANGGTRTWFVQSDNGGGDQMYVWSDANSAWNKGLGFKVGAGGDAYAWHHYAITYSSGVMTSYVDGAFKANYTISGSPNLPTFSNILIGGRSAAWSSWEGPIDDVVIFNSVEDVVSIRDGTHLALIPEPSACALLGLGGLGLVLRRRRL